MPDLGGVLILRLDFFLLFFGMSGYMEGGDEGVQSVDR